MDTPFKNYSSNTRINYICGRIMIRSRPKHCFIAENYITIAVINNRCRTRNIS